MAYRRNEAYTDQGFLQVSVFRNAQALPVDNARISVLDPSSGEIVTELISNASGQTATVDLAAPPLAYSLEEIEEKPYSEYELMVQAEGFAPVRIRGVQILPRSVAYQDIELIPVEESVSPELDISVKDNTLYGAFPSKIPESDVKPLPAVQGFMVLKEPVIPEFIVVHDGMPKNVSAKNYWVPYKDYIKNVASSEIYSTWPEATIEANVLAIISFTLNRVYTEWYRAQGHPYTITSSTAYDHAFHYGRNIFKEISVVVDRLFNKYITKPDIRQPLLTQYCDGRRSKCPDWMTQWGSKALGDQGYSSIDILKKFYGYDIYLEEAERVEGVPSSFPGNDLKSGSTGSDVRTIQEQLNAISKNYPAIKKMAVDGVFGEQTVDSVKTFQKVFHLPISGIVDLPTWYKISNLFVGVTKMAELR
jgi:hypothetical protein